MKKLLHLLGYLFRRQRLWVLLFWLGVVSFVTLIEWEGAAMIVVAILGVLSVINVSQVHDHFDGGPGVLRTRPVGWRMLIGAELVFLFLALVLPAILGVLVILLSYEAGMAAYRACFLSLAFVTSQLAIWYMAGRLSRSHLGAFVLMLLFYLPVMLLWSVVEIRNQHATFDITVLVVLGVTGFASLGLIVAPFLHRTKVALFVMSAVVLLLTMSGVRWDLSEPGRFGPERDKSAIQGEVPSPDEAVSVEFAATAPIDADSMKDSHWDFYRISTTRPDEIFVPTNAIGSPFSKSRSESYRHYLWEYAEGTMLGDLILRNLPAGCDLRGVRALSHNISRMVHAQSMEVEVSEERKFVVWGQKLGLTRAGVVPLRKGESCQAEGCRVVIKELDFKATKLSVKLGMSWVSDSLMDFDRERVQLAWVLYSPSSQRGVLISGGEKYVYLGVEPTLLKRQRKFLDFPLPETFSGGDDLELHTFFINEGEFLKFEVTVPPGIYSAQ